MLLEFKDANEACSYPLLGNFEVDKDALYAMDRCAQRSSVKGKASIYKHQILAYYGAEVKARFDVKPRKYNVVK